MTTYRTGNAIGSADPRDLYDNSENLDELVNSQGKLSHPDRLGVPRKTWHGMEEDFQSFLQSSGYQDLGDYAAGIEITARNQVIRADGELWRLSASVDLPYTTTGAGMPEGGAFVAVGDAVLRQDLANPDKGAAMVARGVVAVDSIADLLALPEGQRKEGLRYLVKGYHAGTDVGGGEFYWDSERTDENDGGSVLDGFVRKVGIVVSPLEFGVTPDGDMTDRVRAAHIYANSNGLPVDYSGLEAATVSAYADIPINTDVDFRGCVFSASNGILEDPQWSDPVNVMFRVKGSSLQTVIIDPASLIKGATRIKDTSGEFISDGMMYLRSSRQMGSRVSAPGTPIYYEQPFFFVGDDATVGVGSDLTGYGVEFASYRPNDRFISIKGLRADKGTYNRQALLFVERNNVSVETPELIGNSVAGINQEITFSSCGNVRLVNILSRGNDPIPSSYVIYMTRVARVTFDGAQAVGGGWGVTGTHTVSDWEVCGGVLRRIDCHQGLHTLRVSGVTMLEQGVSYGWGTGTIEVTDSVVGGAFPVVRCRSDYDGDWEGDIVVDNIRYRASQDAYSEGVDIVDLRRTYRGVGTTIAERVVIKDISLNAPHNTLVRPFRLNTPSSLSEEVRSPDLIRVESVELTSGRARMNMAVPTHAMLAPSGGGLRVDLVNLRAIPVNGRANYLYNAGRPQGQHSTYPVEINIQDCRGVTLYSPANNQELNVRGSDISCLTTEGFESPSESYVYIYDSRIVDSITSDEGGGLGEVPANSVIDGLVVEDNANLYHADAMKGVLVRKGVSCNLPPEVALSDAFYGWLDTAVFE